MKLTQREIDHIIGILSREWDDLSTQIVHKLLGDDESDRDNPESIDMFSDVQDFGQKRDPSPFKKLL